jgi:hypothetical protein
MTSALLLQRGAHPVKLDRERILFFDHIATFELTNKYGPLFMAALYEVQVMPDKSVKVKLKDPEAVPYFLWQGLQAEARENREEVSLEFATAQIRPWTMKKIFDALVMALTGATYVAPGKQQAPGESSQPSANGTVEEGSAGEEPEMPAAAMTSTTRKGSRSGSSAGPSLISGTAPGENLPSHDKGSTPE